MEPLGGSELQERLIHNNINRELLENKNLILSICDPKLLKKDKINIVWQQLSYDQGNVQMMRDRKFVDDVDWFVYNSHWSFTEFRKHFRIPEYKSKVIKNCIEPFPNEIKKPNDNIKLIYTSTPWRGLAILVRAIEELNLKRDDFEVDIYSSTKIYGDEFAKQQKNQYDVLFDKCREIPNINYKGYAPNDEVREALMKSHIFAYPCIFEETSCLSAIEAMAAGCKVVTTNYGVLPETCGEFATYIEFEPNVQRLITNYADTLNKVMNQMGSDETQDDLLTQINHINKAWSVKYRIKEWEAFLADASPNV